MKKRLFATLIEVVIALGLLSLLLSTLFFWYRQLSTQRSKIEIAKWPTLEVRYAGQRLNTIFSRLQDLEPFFTTDNDSSLVFLFDNSPHSQPELAKTVLACLYVDKEDNTLCLGIWPHPSTGKKEPFEKQVLLGNISEMGFTFYNPPPFPRKSIDPPEVGYSYPHRGEQSSWRKNYQTRPAMMIITVTRGKDVLNFAFDLPTSVNTPRLEKPV